MKDKPATKQRILSTIGLSFRAGLMTSGFDAITLALHQGAVELLIVATDGSEKQRDKLLRIAKEEETAARSFGTAEELGQAIGKDNRIAIAILDQGMGKKLLKLIDENKKVEKSAESAE